VIIRINGGKEGIVQYLIHGVMQGRSQSRDELDERAILSGDIELTDQIIKSIEGRGDKYLHITLSFKEDYVSVSQMQKLVRDFEQFAFAAYDDDEYNFYAEAHIPRIKSTQDNKTGSQVNRMPHIHIVIPQVNLKTWKKLNPFGRVTHNISYINAFQEVTNAKYGFASPKDNRRRDLSGKHRIITRTTGYDFTGPSRTFKEDLLGKITDGFISDYSELVRYLKGVGEMKVRNAGTDREYLNIKLPDSQKGINLKEHPFTRGFWHDDKASTENSMEDTYITQGDERAVDPEYVRILSRWFETRAFEVRHVRSGYRKQWNRYKKMSEAEQAEYLKVRADACRESSEAIDPEIFRFGQEPTADRVEQPDIAKEPASEEPTSAMGEERKRRQLRREATMHFWGMRSKSEYRVSFQELLHSLSQTHGLREGKYKGRIKENRLYLRGMYLNPFWFLVNELRMTPTKAADYLVAEYERQQGRTASYKEHAQPDPELWAVFLQNRAKMIKLLKQAWRTQDETFEKLKDKYRSLLSDGNRYQDLSADEKVEQSLKSFRIAWQMQQIIQEERRRAKEFEMILDHLKVYIAWLRLEGCRGDARALREVYDLYPFYRRTKWHYTNVSRYGSSNEDVHPEPPHGPGAIQSLVGEDGSIAYHRNFEPVFIDRGSHLQLRSHRDDDLLVILRLAMSKYGSKVGLQGESSLHVARRLARLARENDIQVTIYHDDLNDPLEVIPIREKVKPDRDRDFSSEL
jgi:hypothetical protein